MRAILVARVSTEEQKDAGNSLPAQQARLENYAAKRGFEVIGTFSFDESAYKTQRDEFDRIVARIEELQKTEKIAVCFDKIDRFSRNLFDRRVARLQELSVEGRIELHFASDGTVVRKGMSASEKTMFGANLVFANFFSNSISDSVSRAFEAKRRNGEWTGKPRLGYINSQDERGRRDIVPDPARKDFIREAFELFATGRYSITTLWVELSRRGLRGHGGRALSRSNVELILKDEFYYGVAFSKKHNMRYPHKYARLITKELYDRCREILRSRKGGSAKEAVSAPKLFQGLVRCARCGCLMSPQTQKGNVYYACSNAKGTCQHRSYIREDKMLAPIQAKLVRLSKISEETKNRIVEQLRVSGEHESDYLKRQVARLRRRYDEIQGQLKVLLDVLISGRITPDVYDEKVRELKDEQQRIEIEHEEYTKADKSFHLNAGLVLDVARRSAEILGESSDVSRKRAFLRLLLQNPTVSGKKLDFTMTKPFEVALKLSGHPVRLPR